MVKTRVGKRMMVTDTSKTNVAETSGAVREWSQMALGGGGRRHITQALAGHVDDLGLYLQKGNLLQGIRWE